MKTKEQAIQATEERIRVFRQRKEFGEAVLKLLAFVVLIALAITFVSWSDEMKTTQQQILKTQEDCMNTLNLMWQDMDKEPEQAAGKAENRLTDEEIALIAGVVMAEAANQGFDGQVAVCEVIKNRSELWGLTITEVLTAPKQFAAPSKATPLSSVYEAINAVFYEDYGVLGGIATHFHSGPEPYWTENKELVAEIKDHKFWY